VSLAGGWALVGNSGDGKLRAHLEHRTLLAS
jgi:hypothetical protein